MKQKKTCLPKNILFDNKGEITIIPLGYQFRLIRYSIKIPKFGFKIEGLFENIF